MVTELQFKPRRAKWWPLQKSILFKGWKGKFVVEFMISADTLAKLARSRSRNEDGYAAVMIFYRLEDRIYAVAQREFAKGGQSSPIVLDIDCFERVDT